MIKNDIDDYKTWATIFFGVVVTIIYIKSGWKMPLWIMKFARLTADDDPSNISPKIYLSLIGLCIMIAVVLFFVFCK